MKTSLRHAPGRRARLGSLCVAALMLVGGARGGPLWGQAPPPGALQEGGGRAEPAWYASLQYVALTWHFDGGAYPQRYPLRLDDEATFVAHAGIVASLDRSLGGRWFVRGSVAGYADCALLPSALLHLGIRWTALRFGRHEVNGGLGPTWVIRRSWHGRVEGYRGDRLFRGGRDGGWESFVVLYGAEVEYLYRTSDKLQIQASAVPWPEGITLKVGARWAW